MADRGNKVHIFVLLFMVNNLSVLAWDTVDFEIFDLVEEIKTNFYDILGVSQSASFAEIRRAYRKLSLQLHPDRSEDPNAEEKFRNLVAVSEILKDEDKRKRYDNVLRDGLPDWRQPVFYYRRVRKMGLFEFMAFIFVILVVGHFIVAWSIYLEKKFELDELLTSAKKKKEKKNRKLIKQGGTVEIVQVEDILSEEGIHKPTFWDLLPFVVYRLIISSIRAVQRRRELHKLQKIQMKLLLEERQREKLAEESPKPKRRQRIVQEIPTVSSEEYAQWKGAPTIGQSSRSDEAVSENGAIVAQEEKKDGEWDEEDLSKLSKLMAKYPGGTPGRWEKVACEMGRSVKDITKQVKQTKSRYREEAVLAGDLPKLVAGKKTVILDDNIATHACMIENNQEGECLNHQIKVEKNGHVSKIPEDKGYSTESAIKDTSSKSPSEEKDIWSRNQQKVFEKALASVAKDAADRWVQISRNVPGKTKEECIARYKFLVEILRKKKREDTEKVG